MAQERRQVGVQTAGADRLSVLREAFPGAIFSGEDRLGTCQVLPTLRQHREGRRAAVAANLRGHALAHGRGFEIEVVVAQKRGHVAVGVGVDEARRHAHAPGLDDARRVGLAQVPDFGDALAAQADVRTKSGSAGPVVDGPVADQDVEGIRYSSDSRLPPRW